MQATVRERWWVLILLLVGVQPAAAQDVLNRARTLYEAAAYEDALQLLDRDAEVAQPGHSEQIDEYRALCLLALNRASEAEAILVRLVASNPDYRPSLRDPTPRFRAAVLKARGDVIPLIAQRIYDEAVAAADRRRYNDASVLLEKLLRIVDDEELEPRLPAKIATAGKALLDISRRSQTVYMTGDAGVTPAVAIRQSLPDPSVITRGIARPHSGEIELIIDATGAVESATLLAPVHPIYDSLLLKAAKAWTFRPARLDGRTVPWRAMVTIQLTVTAAN